MNQKRIENLKTIFGIEVLTNFDESVDALMERAVNSEVLDVLGSLVGQVLRQVDVLQVGFHVLVGDVPHPTWNGC